MSSALRSTWPRMTSSGPHSACNERKFIAVAGRSRGNNRLTNNEQATTSALKFLLNVFGEKVLAELLTGEEFWSILKRMLQNKNIFKGKF